MWVVSLKSASQPMQQRRGFGQVADPRRRFAPPALRTTSARSAVAPVPLPCSWIRAQILDSHSGVYLPSDRDKSAIRFPLQEQQVAPLPLQIERDDLRAIADVFRLSFPQMAHHKFFRFLV